MTIPRKQTQENQAYSAQTPAWKWEKKHVLLLISVGCLALWWFGSNMLEVSLVKPVIKSLPLIGGLCFAADSIIKLTHDGSIK